MAKKRTKHTDVEKNWRVLWPRKARISGGRIVCIAGCDNNNHNHNNYFNLMVEYEGRKSRK